MWIPSPVRCTSRKTRQSTGSRQAYAQLSAMALGGDESVALIAAAAKEL
jgi:hypothetical protein